MGGIILCSVLPQLELFVGNKDEEVEPTAKVSDCAKQAHRQDRDQASNVQARDWPTKDGDLVHGDGSWYSGHWFQERIPSRAYIKRDRSQCNSLIY